MAFSTFLSLNVACSKRSLAFQQWTMLALPEKIMSRILSITCCCEAKTFSLGAYHNVREVERENAVLMEPLWQSWMFDVQISLVWTQKNCATPQFAYNWLHTEHPHAGLTGSWLIHGRCAFQHMGPVVPLAPSFTTAKKLAQKSKEPSSMCRNGCVS